METKLDLLLNKKINDLALDIESSMHEFTIAHRIKTGQEGMLGDILRDARDSVKILSKAVFDLGKMLTPFLLVSARRAEHLLRSYSKLSNVWHMRLENNVNSINTDKFENHVISIISRKELEAKISVALDLFKLIEDTKHICDSRIDINADDAWATSELLKIQKDLVDIGVSVGKFNLVGKMTSSYNASYTKKKIKEHGYDVSSVSQLIDDTEKLGKQSSRQEMKSITRIISTYFEELAQQEMVLSKSNLSEDVKQQKIEEIEIKTMRLWNITMFVKIQQRLIGDILNDLFKICRVMYSYVEKDTEKNQSY